LFPEKNLKKADLIITQYLVKARALALILIICINFLANTSPALAANKDSKLRGSVSNFEDHTIHLKLIPDTLVDTDMSLEGDLFSALLTKPSANILKVPHGSRLIGSITHIVKAKSLNRDAKIQAHINQVMLPDGTTVKVSADLSSNANAQKADDPNSFKVTVGKIAKRSAELTTSAAVGAVDVIQYTGLGTAIATSGISTAIGAGLGLGLGLMGILGSHGDELVISGFDPINFKLESDFQFLEKIDYVGQNLIPVNVELLGIDMKVNSIKKYYSKNYGEFLLLDILVTNKSPKAIFLGDFVLSSDLQVKPILNNPLLSNNSILSIASNRSHNYQLAFSLGKFHKQDNYQLSMIDPVSQELIAIVDVNFADID